MQSPSTTMSLLALLGLRPLSAYRVRSIVAVVLGVCPPIVCAWVARSSANWELFERSGSITAAIGLVVASKRYVKHGIVELAMLRANEKLKFDLAEVLEEIFTAKLGLALLGFGVVISGWGKYLGWWSFSYLVVWAFFAIRDAQRGFIRLRNSNAGTVVSDTS